MTIVDSIRSHEKAPNFSLDVGDHLERRATKPDFVMVEYGHGSTPVAYQQGFEFTGQKAYIGVEAWLRDPINVKREWVDELRARFQDSQNTFFVTMDTGGVVHRDEEEGSAWYEGDYNASTVLPDEAASEVFASNVFCDWLTSYFYKSQLSLLSEMSRAVDTTGTIVLRETISPYHAVLLNEALIQTAGLVIKACVTPDNNTDWEKLEKVYKGDPSEWAKPAPGSYYLFLGKAK